MDPKYPLEYIQKSQEICEDKEKIREFYHMTRENG